MSEAVGTLFDMGTLSTPTSGHRRIAVDSRLSLPELTPTPTGFLVHSRHMENQPAFAWLNQRLGFPQHHTNSLNPLALDAVHVGVLASAVHQGLLADTEQFFSRSRWFDARDGQWKGSGALRDPFSSAVATSLSLPPAPPTPPLGFHGTLQPHQLHTLARARPLSGFACFDEMGLGKTVVAAAWLADSPLPALVVCPAATLPQWHQVIERHLPTVAALVVQGSRTQRARLWQDAADQQIVLASYDTVTADPEEALAVARGRSLVVDEAHRARNPQSRRSRVAYRLASRASRRLILTATPLDNTVAELFWLFSGLVIPHMWGSWNWFRDHVLADPTTHPMLAPRAAPFYTRHALAQVSQMTGHRRTTTVVHPDPALEQQYRDLSREAVPRLRAALPATVTDQRVKDTAVSLLRSAAISPHLLHRSAAPGARALAGLIDDVPGPKVEFAVSVASDLHHRGRRLVVFCSQTALFPLLRRHFHTAGLSVLEYDGSLSHQERATVVEQFTSAAGPAVLIASDAAAEGLNLGAHCRHSLSLDIPYTPGRVAQRSGRVWRWDTAVTTAVHVDVVCAGTIEAGLMAMVTRKRTLCDRLLPATPTPRWRSDPAMAGEESEVEGGTSPALIAAR